MNPSPHAPRELAVLGLLALTLAALWSTPLGAPVRLGVVALHELGHAGAALLSGGEVLHVAVGLDESGETLTRGGWEALVLWWGYPVPVALGAALLGRAGRGAWGDAAGLLLLAGGWADLLGDLRAAEGDAHALSARAGMAPTLWWLSWVAWASVVSAAATWRRARRRSAPGRAAGARRASSPRDPGPTSP